MDCPDPKPACAGRQLEQAGKEVVCPFTCLSPDGVCVCVRVLCAALPPPHKMNIHVGTHTRIASPTHLILAVIDLDAVEVWLALTDQ